MVTSIFCCYCGRVQRTVFVCQKSMFSDLIEVSVQPLGCLSREPVQSLLAERNASITWDSRSKKTNKIQEQQQKKPHWSHEALVLVSTELDLSLSVLLPLVLFHSAVHSPCVPAFICNRVFLRRTHMAFSSQPGRRRAGSTPYFSFPDQSFHSSPQQKALAVHSDRIGGSCVIPGGCWRGFVWG